MKLKRAKPLPSEYPEATPNAPKPPSIRAVAYRRVSGREQVKSGTSLKNQETRIAAHCVSMMYTLIGDYCEEGVSGQRNDRPVFTKMMMDAAAGKFDHIVCTKIDRFGRNLRHLLNTVARLDELGVGFSAFDSNINTRGDNGMLVLSVLGAIAEYEAKLTRERTLRGREDTLAAGKWPAGNPAYGFRRNPDTGKLDVYDVEVVIVRRIYREYAAGATLHAIAGGLNVDHVPTSGRDRKGKPRATGWRGEAVRRIIKNPIYMGKLFMGLGGTKIARSTLARLEAVPDVKIVDVEPIIARATWDYCQSRLESGRRRKTSDNYWLLSGLLDCKNPDCTCNLSGKRSGKKRIYRCLGREQHAHIDGSPRCLTPRIDADVLEEVLWGEIRDAFLNPNTLADIIGRRADELRERQVERDKTLRPLGAQLAEVNRKLKRMTFRNISSNLTDNEIGDILRPLVNDRARLERAISECNSGNETADLDAAAALLAQLNTDTMLFHMSHFYEDVTIRDETGRITGVIPVPPIPMDGVDGGVTARQLMATAERDDPTAQATNPFPTTRRALLDWLRIRLHVYCDHIEVKGILPLPNIRVPLMSSSLRAGAAG